MPKIDVKKVFGTSVRGRRSFLGISQEELAERADLHRTYVSDVERGARNLSLESIERLAHALDISISSLFPQSEAPSGRKNNSNAHAKELVDILLVEDDADDAEMALHAFKKARFANRVHVVSDGAEALDYLFSRGKYAARQTMERPHIILLDLKLPKVSGIEVLRRIKADKRMSAIPVVILTISDDNYDIAECRRLGADNYIVKPLDFQRLSQATPQLNLNWALLKPLKSNGRNVRA